MPPDENVPIRVRDYVDARFSDHDKQHSAEQRALEAARAASDARLEGMNEFRATVSDAQRHYVSREVIDAMYSAMGERVDLLAAQAQRGAILAGITSGILGIIGGVIIATLLHVP